MQFSKQNAVNANTPVSIAGRNIYSGPSSATQNASSDANTTVSNNATTNQRQGLCQNVGSDSNGCGRGREIITRDGKEGRDGKNGCYAGCGGPGGFQLGIQNSKTNQGALGLAFSDQNAVNSNAPVNIAGGDVKGARGSSSSADQTASSSATTNVTNTANTHQDQMLCQNVGSSSKGDCGKKGRDGRHPRPQGRQGRV